MRLRYHSSAGLSRRWKPLAGRRPTQKQRDSCREPTVKIPWMGGQAHPENGRLCRQAKETTQKQRDFPGNIGPVSLERRVFPAGLRYPKGAGYSFLSARGRRYQNPLFLRGGFSGCFRLPGDTGRIGFRAQEPPARMGRGLPRKSRCFCESGKETVYRRRTANPNAVPQTPPTMCMKLATWSCTNNMA